MKVNRIKILAYTWLSDSCIEDEKYVSLIFVLGPRYVRTDQFLREYSNTLKNEETNNH